MLNRRLLLAVLLFAILSTAFAAAQQQAQAPAPSPAAAPVVNGATNFCRLDDKFALGGNTTPEGFAAIKQLGYKTVINLRTATEPGSDIPAEAAAADKLGLKYISLPFTTATPDIAVVDKFLAAAKDESNQPIYIHCQSGQRASAFWMIKRVLLDGWTVEKATAEADQLKLTNQALRKFALAYIEDHKGQ